MTKTRSNGVSHGDAHDWDRAGRLLPSSHRQGRHRNDHVHPNTDKLGGDLGKAFLAPCYVAGLDDHVSALDPAKITHPSEKESILSLDLGARRRDKPQITDSNELFCLLPLT